MCQNSEIPELPENLAECSIPEDYQLDEKSSDSLAPPAQDPIPAIDWNSEEGVLREVTPGVFQIHPGTLHA